jgi:hypothetical protein
LGCLSIGSRQLPQTQALREKVHFGESVISLIEPEDSTGQPAARSFAAHQKQGQQSTLRGRLAVQEHVIGQHLGERLDHLGPTQALHDPYRDEARAGRVTPGSLDWELPEHPGSLANGSLPQAPIQNVAVPDRALAAGLGMLSAGPDASGSA